MVLGDQRNHVLLSVQGNQQYHVVQQDLEVQKYQQSPVKKSLVLNNVCVQSMT